MGSNSLSLSSPPPPSAESVIAAQYNLPENGQRCHEREAVVVQLLEFLHWKGLTLFDLVCYRGTDQREPGRRPGQTDSL